MKKGFTLIELLAVIIILAVVALIATPVVLNAVNSAKESARKSQLALYADSIKQQLTSSYLTNGGKYSEVIDLSDDNLDKAVTCGEVHYTKESKVLLGNCIIKGSNDSYWYMNGEISNEKPNNFETLKANLLSSNEYIDSSGANKPVLFTDMKPVIWNGEEFVEANRTERWYDYDAKEWANAQTKDGSYWVWIPRYAYKITSGYNSSTTGTIDIKFLSGTTNTTKDGTKIETSGYEAGVKDTSTNYFLHPVFEFDGEKTGFWVAKYESTAVEGVASDASTCNGLDNVDTKTVRIIPNATSWRCISIKNAYTVSLNMKDKTDIYGWLATEVDTHLMKNTEWGAVAYLSKSKYGADTLEVWNNAYNQFKTGCSGSGVNAKNESTCVAYNTENGVKASTTHNEYGVYDMSGGAWERVMGNYNNLPSGSEFTTQELFNMESKYINRYTTPTEELLNGVGMNYDNVVYGDAVFETSNDAYRYNGSTWSGKATGSWYGNQSHQPKSMDPFFIRGGTWGDDSFAGLFAFNATYGLCYVHNSFRPTVFMK